MRDQLKTMFEDMMALMVGLNELIKRSSPKVAFFRLTVGVLLGCISIVMMLSTANIVTDAAPTHFTAYLLTSLKVLVYSLSWAVIGLVAVYLIVTSIKGLRNLSRQVDWIKPIGDIHDSPK